MRLAHNLGAVSARLSRLQSRDIPVALERALHRPEWLGLVEKSAKQSLLAVADPQHRQLIDIFLTTLLRTTFPSGVAFSLRTPPELRSTHFTLDNFMAGKQGTRRVQEPAGVGDSIKTVLTGPVAGWDLFSQAVNDLDAIIEDWVGTEKHKDQRDWGKSDEEIAHFISYALLMPDGGGLTVRSGKNKGRLVRDVFLPHIEKFLAQQQAAPLDPAIIHAWLEAVRHGWRELFRAQYPDFARHELHATREELAL